MEEKVSTASQNKNSSNMDTASGQSEMKDVAESSAVDVDVDGTDGVKRLVGVTNSKYLTKRVFFNS